MSNIVLPTVELQGRLTPFHVIRTSEVKVDVSECFKLTEWDKKAKAEVVYYGLGKPALAKIAQAAGISWDAALTGIVGQPTADYLLYRAVARMSLPDGQPVSGIGTVEWFASEEVEPARVKLEEAIAAGESAGRVTGLRKALSDTLRYRVPMCESKAMNRAIRQLLGLKGKYKPEELREAFVVPRVEYVPDIDNPNVRQLLAARVDITQSALYGTTADTTTQRPALVAPAEDMSLGEMADFMADAGAEVVVIDEEAPLDADGFEDASFDNFDEMPAGALPGDPDPRDYVITDGRSAFKDMTLHQVEQKKPGYCEWVVANHKGSKALQDACRTYLVSYLPDSSALDAPQGGE